MDFQWKVEVQVGPIQIRKGDDCMLGEGVNSKDMIKFSFMFFCDGSNERVRGD